MNTSPSLSSRAAEFIKWLNSEVLPEVRSQAEEMGRMLQNLPDDEAGEARVSGEGILHFCGHRIDALADFCADGTWTLAFNAAQAARALGLRGKQAKAAIGRAAKSGRTGESVTRFQCANRPDAINQLKLDIEAFTATGVEYIDDEAVRALALALISPANEGTAMNTTTPARAAEFIKWLDSEVLPPMRAEAGEEVKAMGSREYQWGPIKFEFEGRIIEGQYAFISDGSGELGHDDFTFFLDANQTFSALGLSGEQAMAEIDSAEKCGRGGNRKASKNKKDPKMLNEMELRALVLALTSANGVNSRLH